MPSRRGRFVRLHVSPLGCSSVIVGPGATGDDRLHLGCAGLVQLTRWPSIVLTTAWRLVRCSTVDS